MDLQFTKVVIILTNTKSCPTRCYIYSIVKTHYLFYKKISSIFLELLFSIIIKHLRFAMKCAIAFTVLLFATIVVALKEKCPDATKNGMTLSKHKGYFLLLLFSILFLLYSWSYESYPTSDQLLSSMWSGRNKLHKSESEHSPTCDFHQFGSTTFYFDNTTNLGKFDIAMRLFAITMSSR